MLNILWTKVIACGTLAGLLILTTHVIVYQYMYVQTEGFNHGALTSNTPVNQPCKDINSKRIKEWYFILSEDRILIAWLTLPNAIKGA